MPTKAFQLQLISTLINLLQDSMVVRRGLGRIRSLIVAERSVDWYVGPDGCGEVFMIGTDEEHIWVNGEKRYWNGVNFPIDRNSVFNPNLTLCLVKPSQQLEEISQLVQTWASKYKFKLIQIYKCRLQEHQVRAFYPYYMAPNWGKELFKYLTSGDSRIIVFNHESAIVYPKRLKSLVRYLLKVKKNEVQNAIHLSDNPRLAAREARILQIKMCFI